MRKRGFMFSQEHLYSIALRRCKSVGDINFSKLVKILGSAENVWNFPKSEFINLGIGSKIIHDIGNSEHLHFAENELKFCNKNSVQIKLRHLNELPGLLSECNDAPAILYAKGTYSSLLKPVSIVGTRNVTSYGKQFIQDFLSACPNKKIQTISGLAYGVDAEVHQQSIEKKIPTVAVLAHGFHTLYPSKHRKLSEKIIEENGVLFTEFNSSQKPDRENFIQRNRIIAGISPSTLIIETAFGGGSISTATFANSYNRDVFALPGRVSDKYSQGCNQLIFQNKAAIISTIKNLVNELGFCENTTSMEELFTSSETELQLTEIQTTIYKALIENKLLSLDDISEKTEIPTYKILPELLHLELLGKVKTFSGQQFSAL